MLTGALALVALAGSWAAFQYLPTPYLWIYGIGVAFCAAGTARSSRKALWFNLGLPLLVLFGLEAWANVQSQLSTEGSETEGYILPDAVLGYRPAPGYRAHQRRSFEGAVVYDVTYTIDEDGLRLAPPVAPDGGEECIVFFGGSFTFGEGTEDDQALPYRTGVETDGRYRVYNFGFHGYGPHQMLAALEEGLVDQILDCRPRFVIYQGIGSHTQRVAGLMYWDTRGPRFVLVDDGSVERRGHFADGRWVWPVWLTEAVGKSRLFTKILHWNRAANDDDHELFVGVLTATRRVVESRYPDSEFHIVFWDKPRRGVATDLQKRGFRVHKVTEILPDRNANRARYQIHALDRHPNARAHAEIARYIAREIIADAGKDNQ